MYNVSNAVKFTLRNKIDRNGSYLEIALVKEQLTKTKFAGPSNGPMKNHTDFADDISWKIVMVQWLPFHA